MKRLISLVLSLVLVVSLVACNNADPSSGAVPPSGSSSSAVSNPSTADVALDNSIVEVTVPAGFFEGIEMSVEEIMAQAGVNGMEAAQNADGSFTYKIPKGDHVKMMAEMEVNLRKGLDGILETEGTSITSIKPNSDYTKISIYVDKAKYENNFVDSIASLGIVMSASVYQMLDGKDTETAKVTLDYIDMETDEVLSTTVFPDDMETDE